MARRTKSPHGRRMATTRDDAPKPRGSEPGQGPPTPAAEDPSRVDTLNDEFPEGGLQLVVLSGKATGQSFPLREITTVGREDRCHITIADPRVSREHAIIQRVDDNRFAVADLNSRNGTWVNGARLEDGVEIGLGDRLQLGPNVVTQVTSYQPIERQLTQRARLETVGRLASGVAHDLNNMLAAIITNLACIGSTNLDDDEQQCLKDIYRASKNAADLTPRLLDLVRPIDTPPQRVDVSAVCRDAQRLMGRTVSANVSISAQIEPRIYAMGNAADLYHALINLCINACDAMPMGGNLELEVSTWEDKAVITVSDTGVGIDQTLVESVFEPFFSTKDHGSGLGLVSVREAASGFGGTVDVRSRKGFGTTFRLILPTVPAASPTRPTPMPFGALALSGGRVLVAEDDVAVASSIRRLLKSHGALVQIAESGEACLDALALWRPDVIIIDLDLPGMSGEELLARLSKTEDPARVLVHSGNARRTALLREKYGPDLDALDKPADPTDLLTMIGAAVGKAREQRRGRG
jgi:signal transduction histidine kinase/ActR/RegA family two-component response regulator